MATEIHPIKAAALKYADRGFRTIPLHTAKGGCCSCHLGFGCPEKSQGKHPIENGWQKADRLSVADIETWWGDERPRNIGIATGPDSDVFVVDVDPDNDGDESIKALVAEHGREWLKTYRVKTGSGGWHFYYRYPDFEIGNSASTKLGKGLDTRGKGGYVVTAPSISGKGPYVEHDAPIIDAPQWLLEMLRPKERKAPDGPVVPVDKNIPPAERERLDGYAEGAVTHEISRLRALSADGWDGAPWDATTYEVACNLLELANATWNAYSIQQAHHDVFENAPRDPGFGDDRVTAKLNSAATKVGDHGALYPPKPAGAFWLEDEDTEDSALATPAPSPGVDDFMAGTHADEPEPTPSIDVKTFQGIPVAKGTLVPDYAARAAAALLGSEYSSKKQVEIVDAASELNLEDLIRAPELPDQELDLTEVEAWIERNLRSGTPERLWAALGIIFKGIDTTAPVMVLKGGGPILALLARVLRPEVGEDPETVHAGPRFSTKDHPGDQVVFEFADESMDLMPYARSITQRALDSAAEVRAEDGVDHDDLDDMTDYRAAQLHRARLGMGSRGRQEDDF